MSVVFHTILPSSDVDREHTDKGKDRKRENVVVYDTALSHFQFQSLLNGRTHTWCTVWQHCATSGGEQVPSSLSARLTCCCNVGVVSQMPGGPPVASLSHSTTVPNSHTASNSSEEANTKFAREVAPVIDRFNFD